MTIGAFEAADEFRTALDLSVCHQTYFVRGVTVRITWLRGEEGWEPCIALTRAHDQSAAGVVPCIVPLSRAWTWSDKASIDAIRETMLTAALFADNLGMSSMMPSDVFKVRGIIEDHLYDLITCPPRPRMAERVAAEMQVTDNETGRVYGTEVMDEV